jgi:hypothetical protein
MLTVLHCVCGRRTADIEFASPDNHYLASITVNAGKVYAMFIKSPERVRPGRLTACHLELGRSEPVLPKGFVRVWLQIFPEAEASLRAIRESFHTIDQV